MNKTEIFFKDLIDKEDRKGIKKKFVELYVEKGYDMLIQDCAELLDVEEKWLVRSFGGEFDYFIAPSPATTVFANNRVLIYGDLCEKLGYVDSNLGAIASESNIEKWLTDSLDMRIGLARKRIFVNRESFYKFIKRNLTVINEFKRVAIPRADLKNLSNSKLDKIKIEMLTQFNIGEVNKNGKFKFNEVDGPLTEVHFDTILKEKLYSGKTIKEGFIGTVVDSYLIKKIHDTQLYRWLDIVNVTKITLTPKNNQMPVVRYLFPFDINKELGLFNLSSDFLKDNYVFNIPSHLGEAEVIEKFLFYVDLLDSEALLEKK